MIDASTSASKTKKDILNKENEKKTNGNYDSDFSDYTNKETSKAKNKKKYSSSSSRSPTPEKKTKKKVRSPSRSTSRSRSRSNDSYDDKKNKKNNGRGRSYSPTSTNSRSTIIKKKAQSIQAKNRDTNLSNYKSTKGTSKFEHHNVPSATGSCPAPLNDRNSTQNRNRKTHAYLNTQSKMKGQPFHSSSDQLGQVNKTGRLLSAQRIKNNDLQNRISELNIEIEKLREENRTIKRMHKREEVALKKLETQDTDVTKVVKGYQDEINSLKQKIRKIQSENRTINNSLLDREDEVRVLKKKNTELKDILNDKNLIESAELTKKLEATEHELAEQRSKYQNLERRIDISEKNHKHEIGVEIAHHKETQKQLNKLIEEAKELKVKLEEKERSLEAMNIYSRANRDTNPPPAPLWKASSTSLNGLNVQDSPHDKRKAYDMKVKEKLNKGNDGSKQNTERDKVKPDSDRREKPPKHSQNDLEEDSLAEHKKKIDQDRKRLEEEAAELERKDAAEKLRREHKEKEEKERIDRLRREAAELELDRKKKEEEERRLKEKAMLENLDRKKRWVVNDVDEDTGENKKKNDLLAKLFSSAADTSFNAPPEPLTITPAPQPVVKKNVFETKPPAAPPVVAKVQQIAEIPSIPSTNNGNHNNTNGLTNGKSSMNGNSINGKDKNNTPDSYKFPRKIENLHEGKPVYPRDDDLFSNHSSNTGKNDLLDKLFGNSDKSTSKNNNNNNNNSDFLQKKLDKLDDFPDGAKLNSKPANKTTLQTSQSFKSNTTQDQNTSKVPFLPWDLPEAQVGTPSSTKKPTNNNDNSIFNTSSGSGGGGFFNTPPANSIRRPRETNTIITSNKPTNSNNFIEDIEELAL